MKRFLSLAILATTASPSYAEVSSQVLPAPVKNPAMMRSSALITQQNFKTWLNIDVQGASNNVAAIAALIQSENTAAQKQLQAYYQKLRLCSAGTYKYAIPNPRADILPNQSLYVLASSTIAGLVNGKCKVTNNMMDQLDQVCLYSAQHLNLFTNAQATDDLKNPFTVNRSVMNQVVKEDCSVVSPTEARAAYFKALENCTPGTYKYNNTGSASPITNALKQGPKSQEVFAMTAVIAGKKNALCVVDTTNPTIKPLHCEYSKDSIDFLVAQEKKPPVMANSNPGADLGADDIDQSMKLMEDCGLMPKD